MHNMHSKIQKKAALSKPLRRGFTAAVLAVAAAVASLTITAIAAAEAYTVHIYDGDVRTTIQTAETDPFAILDNWGFSVSEQDAVTFTGFEQNEGEIHIRRAEASAEEGTPPAQPASVKPAVITESPVSLLTKAAEQLAAGGRDAADDTDSEEAAVTEIADEAPPADAPPQLELAGGTIPSVSSLNFEYSLDQNGEPIGFRNVFRGQRAAGYSARSGAKTASGMDAVVGHVAVNPNVIPYGTKLYIKSSDGSFVYGYAVAADTGTAIRNGVIAVDLFYGSYAESAQNGIKYVDIFILD